MHSAKTEVVHALKHLANKIETTAVKIVDRRKMVAWGKLRRSLKTKVDPERLAIDVFADDRIAPYAQYVHEGRKPGKMPPVSMIEEWARKKRLLSKPNRKYKGERSLYSEDLAKTRLSARINTSAKLSKKQQRLADRYHSLAWRIAYKMKHREIKPRRFLLDAILATLKKELS
mgnify:CR=1 FL=1|jgi:hypothetical protein